MKLIKKINALVLSLAVLLAFGCAENNRQSDPEPVQKNCTVTKRFATGINAFSSAGSTTQEVTLNNLGQIAEVLHKVSHGSAIDEITGKTVNRYNGSGQLIRKDFYPYPDNRLLEFYLYEYNADGLLAKVKGFHLMNNDTIKGINDSLVYYPDKRIKRYYYNPAVYYDFVYPGANKVIKKEIVFDGASNQEVVQNLYEIELDSKKSPKANTFLFSSPPRGSADFESNVVSMKTTNYVLGFTVTVTNSYQYNSDDYPVSWTQTNTRDSVVNHGTYDYNCQ